MSQGPDSFVSCRAEIQAQPGFLWQIPEGFLCPAQLLDTSAGTPQVQPPVRQPARAARVGGKTRLGRRRLHLLLVLSMGALGNETASSPDTPFYHTSAELPDPPHHIQMSQALYALIKVELVGSLNFSRIFYLSALPVTVSLQYLCKSSTQRNYFFIYKQIHSGFCSCDV